MLARAASTTRGIRWAPHRRWPSEAELLCVAPATANLLAKAARGLADDLLSTLYLSFTGPVLVAPAMNCEMWEKPAVQRNVAQLAADGVHFVDPEEGWLSCRATGDGPHGRARKDIRRDRAACCAKLKSKRERLAIVARILITSGPTRQYLDPVRYLTNASSGRMGKALAEAALARGHEVVIVSGPVDVDYPPAAEVVPVVSTEEMLAAAASEFPDCDGLIGVAAPCDYRPVRVEPQQDRQDRRAAGAAPDRNGRRRRHARRGKDARQWVVGFALETEDHRLRALAKLEKKSCDLMVLNGPEAMNATENSVEILDQSGQVVSSLAGSKEDVARGILRLVQKRLIEV